MLIIKAKFYFEISGKYFSSRDRVNKIPLPFEGLKTNFNDVID